jgi:tetratricopeptide (TPR) repeat protein
MAANEFENDSGTVHSGTVTNTAPDQARLDDAMKRADELLVSSLRADEQRRARRKLLTILLGSVAAIAAAIFVGLFLSEKATSTPEPAYLTANQVRAEMLIKEGQQQLKDGRQNRDEIYVSVATFKKAIKLTPESIEAWSGLAEAFSRTGQLGPAEEAHKKVLKLDPQNNRTPWSLGQLYITQHRYQEAEDLLLKLVESAPKQAGATAYLLNDLYRKLGDTEAAQEWSEKIPQPPARVQTEREKRRDRTFTERDKAKIRMDREREKLPFPETASEETLQAWALFKTDYQGEAADLFNRLTTKDPRNAEAWSGLGWHSLLYAWLELEDKTYSFLRGRGSQQTQQKNAQRRADQIHDHLQKAKECFDRALEINPASASAMDGTARILQLQDDPEGATKAWKELVAKHPNYQPGLAILADAYLEQNELQKAILVLEQLAKLRPRDRELKEKLARVKSKVSEGATNATTSSK